MSLQEALPTGARCPKCGNGLRSNGDFHSQRGPAVTVVCKDCGYLSTHHKIVTKIVGEGGELQRYREKE